MINKYLNKPQIEENFSDLVKSYKEQLLNEILSTVIIVSEIRRGCLLSSLLFSIIQRP